MSLIAVPRLLRRFLSVPLLSLALIGPAMAEVNIQSVTSPGGITAWLSEDHEIPMLSLEIRFRGGTSLDRPEKRGAVYLMAALIEEGTGEMDSRAFAEARDALASHLSFSASPDMISASALMLSETRDATIDLLAAALARPRFDQDAVDRVRGQVLAGLRSDEMDPATLAARAFDKMAFGTHPYASPGEGNVQSVSALTQQDIFDAHRATIARDRIYVAAAGDITAADLGALLDRLFADLPAEGAPLPPTAPYLAKPGVTLLPFPSPQSVVYFGHEGISRDDPDFFAAYILNEVLGGGRFSARLMREVREKRGLTYGIGSYLLGMDHAELLMGQFAASNDKVAEAIAVVRAEWARIADEGISEEELARTKTYLTGAYPLRFSSNSGIAAMLVAMQMEEMPIDYPNIRNDLVNAVTLEDVTRVAKMLYRAEDLRFIIVGQPEGVTPTP